MAYKFLFVGIDRYRDNGIRDLSGAANDAKAMWALFEDTFPGAQSHLMVDTVATFDAVTNSIEAIFANAIDEDVAQSFVTTLTKKS